MTRRRASYGAVPAVLLMMVASALYYALALPGDSAPMPLAAETAEETALAASLEGDVRALSVDIGVRNMQEPEALARAADWLDTSWSAAGYEVEREAYEVGGAEVENLFTELPGNEFAHEVVVVGAHYDSAEGTPGADDNASGVAALLALSRAFAGAPRRRTIRFVAFVNEEPPYFQTDAMGSLVHARGMAEAGANVTAMLSLETMAFFRDEGGTQSYPFPLSLFFPDTGTFLAFVADFGSRDLLHRSVATFRDASTLPSEGAALPGDMPGVDWSDHWSFWQAGYPGVMVTDTAPFRNPHYHEATDLPEELDYGRLARAVVGLERVVDDLAQGE
ncbi:MAG: M28 family peptidase [Deltaproteobacteria bacterium]|nr:M28 family peptidase [Deltaproteobacteria bacterium]